MKKSEIRKLDALFSKQVRSLGYCEFCGGKSTNLNCAHIFSRKYQSTRWLKANALCLCPRCHFTAHSRPTEFADNVISKLGRSGYEELRRKSYEQKKLFYEDVLKALTSSLS